MPSTGTRRMSLTNFCGAKDWFTKAARLRLLDRQLTPQCENGIPLDNHSIGPEFTPQFSAALRNLASVQAAFAQALAPIRRERTVRRTSHWVFRDAVTGREIARDKIGIFTRRSNCNTCRMKVFKHPKIRTYTSDILFSVKNGEVVVLDLHHASGSRS